MFWRRGLPCSSVAGVLLACGGAHSSSPGTDAGPADSRPSDVGTTVDARGGDAGSESSSADDGTPSYTASCTALSKQTGTAIDTPHGRLDGYLSFVVPIGGSNQCNGDNSHLHLQVRMGGDIYDVAVDTGTFDGDVNLYEANMAMPDGAWSEGWHGDDALTYTSLGIHSGEFAPQEPAMLGQKIATELVGVNHISIFGTGYPQGNGCHDVHYHDGDGQDGALVIEPLSATPHILFFRFSTDTF
jgi:hypothetical protein